MKGVFVLTDIEKIRELDLQNVEPEHFLEIGSDVLSALRHEIGDDAVKDIYSKAKGEDTEGFAKRFANELEQYAEEHPELFENTDVGKREDVYPPELKDDIIFSLDELRDKYQEMRDTHLSRNIFVSWEKLRVDIAARQNDEVGADGKYKVSGGTIAVDILGIIRGNIFETIIEEVLRRMLDSIFPAERDPVSDDEMIEGAVDTGTERGELLEPAEFINNMGIHDNGFVEDASRLNQQEVSAIKSANPLFGQHFGFDMTKSGFQSGSMKMWRGGFSQNVDAVVNGEVKSTGIPNISMVELQGNLYHVSPFGEILNSEIKNPRAELPIGSRIDRVDISSKGGRAAVFEALAIEAGCSVDELKDKYTAEVKEDFISKVANGIELHSAYLTGTALPEIEQIKESFLSDRFVLQSREEALRTEIEQIKEEPEKADRLKDLEVKLGDISSHEDSIDKGIHRCEERETCLRETLERYDEAKEAISQKDIDVNSKYLIASNLEKDAAGRTEISEYLPGDIDHSVKEFVGGERDDLLHDIEKYNAANPDNMLREKDGSIYNRFGVSETGNYNPEMCDPVDKPETDNPAEIEEYTQIHETDGFEEFSDYLVKGTALPDVEKTEQDVEASEVKPADTEKPENISPDTDKGEILPEPESVQDKPDVEVIIAGGSDPVESEDMASEDVVALENQPIDQEQIKEKTEGGYDGDIPEIASEGRDNEIDKGINLDTDLVKAADQNELQEKDLNEKEGKEEKENEDVSENKFDEEDILDGFRDYLSYDTYSFGGDLVPQLSDMDTAEADHLLLNALSDLYIDSSLGESETERLYYLTMEVAAYNDNGVMPAIEELVDDLQNRGMNDFDVAQTLIEMEPYVLGGIEDLMAISTDEVDQRTIKLGDDIWTVSANSIVNDTTGQEEDPYKLADLIREGTNRIYGDHIGDTAVDQTLAAFDNTIDGHELDFLDTFFNSSLETTLKDIMNDLMSVEMKEAFVDDTAISDQFEDPADMIEISDDMSQFEGLEDIESLVIPDYLNDPCEADADTFMD